MKKQTFGENLSDQLKAINAIIGRGVRAAFEPIGLTRGQGTVLTLCQKNGGSILVSELCAVMETPASNVTNICNRLESAGLIEKKRGTDDRRKVTVQITSQGKERVSRILQSHDLLMSLMSGSATQAESDTILDGLGCLIVLLKRNFAAAGLPVSDRELFESMDE